MNAGEAMVTVIRADDADPVSGGQPILDCASSNARSHCTVDPQPDPFLIGFRTAVIGEDLGEWGQFVAVHGPVLRPDPHPVCRVVGDRVRSDVALPDLGIELCQRIASDKGLVVFQEEDVVISR